MTGSSAVVGKKGKKGKSRGEKKNQYFLTLSKLLASVSFCLSRFTPLFPATIHFLWLA